jgi:hypothetical protein
MSHHSNSGKPMVSDGVMDQADALLKKSKAKSDGRKLGRGPAMVDKIKSIRLPVGLAVTLSIQRMAERREGDNDLTSGHDERYQVRSTSVSREPCFGMRMSLWRAQLGSETEAESLFNSGAPRGFPPPKSDGCTSTFPPNCSATN